MGKSPKAQERVKPAAKVKAPIKGDPSDPTTWGDRIPHAPVETAAPFPTVGLDTLTPFVEPDLPKCGSFEYFTVAEALTGLGRDSLYSSSHPIHRAMIGVLIDKCGTITIGLHVEEKPEDFERTKAYEHAVNAALGNRKSRK